MSVVMASAENCSLLRRLSSVRQIHNEPIAVCIVSQSGKVISIQ